jgi:hypothetical protein
VVQQQLIPGTSIQTTDLNGRKISYTFEAGSTGPFGNEAAGQWLNYYEACLKYVWIFVLYRLFGDNGLLLKYRLGCRLHRALLRRTGKAIPGWYDTHATLARSFASDRH